jgi:hypothetical protein
VRRDFSSAPMHWSDDDTPTTWQDSDLKE